MNDQLGLMIFISMAPLTFAGVVFIMGKVGEIMMVKKGRVKAYIIANNRRVRKVFAKPTGSQMKIGQKIFSFKNTPDYLTYEGSVPVTFYNEKTSEQLNMFNTETQYPVEPEYFDNLIVRSYNLGRLSSLVADKKMMLFLLICVLASAGACGIGVMNFMAIKDVIEAGATAVAPVVV